MTFPSNPDGFGNNVGQVYCNHLQITYYLLLILVIIGLFKLLNSIKNQDFTSFFKRSFILIVAGLLGASTSFTRLSTTMEYGKDSTRGKSKNLPLFL